MKPIGLRPFAWDLSYRKGPGHSYTSQRRSRLARVGMFEFYEDRIVGPPRRGTLRASAIAEGLGDVDDMPETVCACCDPSRIGEVVCGS